MKRLLLLVLAITTTILAQVMAKAEVITLYCTNGRYLSNDLTNYLPLGDPDTTVIVDTLARTVNNIPADVFDESKIIYRFISNSRSEDGGGRSEWVGQATINRVTGQLAMSGMVTFTVQDRPSGSLYHALMYDCGLTKPKPKF